MKIYPYRSCSRNLGNACPPLHALLLSDYSLLLDDELSKSGTKVSREHLWVNNNMACPKKSLETKEITRRKILPVKVRGQVISQTKWLTSLTKLHFIKFNEANSLIHLLSTCAMAITSVFFFFVDFVVVFFLQVSVVIFKWLLLINNGNTTEWSLICIRVWLQTELDQTKSYYQLILKIFVEKEDVFVNSLTGSGKSLIYQALPLMFDHVSDKKRSYCCCCVSVG